MLLTPGHWPSTYWPSSYWVDDYWADYGLVTPPTPTPTPTPEPTRGGSGVAVGVTIQPWKERIATKDKRLKEEDEALILIAPLLAKKYFN